MSQRPGACSSRRALWRISAAPCKAAGPAVLPTAQASQPCMKACVYCTRVNPLSSLVLTVLEGIRPLLLPHKLEATPCTTACRHDLTAVQDLTGSRLEHIGRPVSSPLLPMQRPNTQWTGSPSNLKQGPQKQSWQVAHPCFSGWPSGKQLGKQVTSALLPGLKQAVDHASHLCSAGHASGHALGQAAHLCFSGRASKRSSPLKARSICL